MSDGSKTIQAPGAAEPVAIRVYTSNGDHEATFFGKTEQDAKARRDLYLRLPNASSAAIPMRLSCPDCGALHIDEGEFATKPHHTHACQHCGNVWRPAVVDTVGVRFLPGFKNGEAP